MPQIDQQADLGHLSFDAQLAYLGWSNADLSAFELPASYCAEALLIYKIVKRLS